MNRLKTLEDFEINPKSWAGAMANAGRKYTIDIPELKQEVIKWVKKWRHDMVSHGCVNEPCRECILSVGKIEGVMKLNNITEEDLEK